VPGTKDEVKKKGRRLQAMPQFYFAEGRKQPLQQRFKELGNQFDRVWVALGGKMRRRRIGRSVDVKDMRYYWRPIEPQYQRLYMSRLRRHDHSNPKRPPMSLRSKITELGHVTSTAAYEQQYHQKYGRSVAIPPRLDFEYRVF
jgi:hypothetical protein